MQVETVKMDEVRLLEGNPRRHPEVQIEALVASVQQFGQYRPLVVDEDGVILAGNGLYTALLRAGHEEVRVHRLTGLTEAQKTKLILADNKTGSLSSDDYDRVDEMLRSLDDFEVPGYDPDVLRELLGSVEEVLETADSFGVLDEATRDRMLGRSEQVNEAREGALTGSLPAAAVPGTPQAGVPDEVKEQAGGGTICPTCKRAW